MSDLNKLRKFLDDDYRVSYLDSHVKGSIAYQIQALREHLGLNQTDFGALVGMPQAVISRLENAENGGVNVNTLLKIAHGLKIGLAVRFCDFRKILAEDVSPAGFLVENIQTTVSRSTNSVRPKVVAADDLVLVASILPSIIESNRIWQTQPLPNQPPPQHFQGSGTPNFEKFMPMQASLP